jgi:hypothetical protein
MAINLRCRWMMRKPIAKLLLLRCSPQLKGEWSNWQNKIFIYPASIMARVLF